MPSSVQQISDIIKMANKNSVPYMIIGKGSNILFGDGGYDGVIINIGKNLSETRMLSGDSIYCGAGMSLSGLCLFAMENSLCKLEFAYGIPGSVGGAAYMNAGAYGGEMSDVLVSVDYIDSDGNMLTCAGDALELSYRHSFFTDKPYCIVGCTFKLKPGDKQSIKQRMDELMEKRKSKQPLDYPSAGSTFKRPVGGYASALIDECGLKGFRVGGAMVSEKHAGFVINYDNATCTDVEKLVNEVKKVVREQTGYSLECEIKIVK